MALAALAEVTVLLEQMVATASLDLHGPLAVAVEGRELVVAPPGTIRAAATAAPAVVKVSTAARQGRELRGKALLAEARPVVKGVVAGVVRAESGVTAEQMAARVEPD